MNAMMDAINMIMNNIYSFFNSSRSSIHNKIINKNSNLNMIQKLRINLIYIKYFIYQLV